MSRWRMRPQPEVWRFGARMVILLASSLVPLQACAQPGILQGCAGKSIEIDDSGVRLCVRSGEGHAWVSPAPGKGFGTMARACCIQADQVQAVWEEKSQQGPKAETWYPVELALLKEELRPKLLQGAAPPLPPNDPGNGRDSDEEEVSKDPNETAGGGSRVGGGTGTGAKEPNDQGGTDEDEGESSKSSTPFLLAMTALGLSLAALGGTAFWNRKLRVRLAQVEHETAAIKESLVGLRAGIPQKITVELIPPLAAKFPDWEPFLYKVRDALGHPAGAARTEARVGVSSSAFGPAADAAKVPGGVERQRLDPFPAQVSVRAARQETSGERRYVERATTYGAAAQNFGGEIVFQEANGDWGSFYIEPVGQRNGWLYPNPSAREFDPLHQKLFNLGINDFPLKVNVDPRPVLWDGQRWVLDSQGA